MHPLPDILSIASRQPVLQDELHLLEQKEQQMPGSVHYSIRRYHKNKHWGLDEAGMLIYHYRHDTPANNYLELKFCVTGSVYCQHQGKECDRCRISAVKGGRSEVDSVDVLSFRFSPMHLSQYVKPFKLNQPIANDILSFEYKSSFSKILAVCSKTRMVLEALLNHSYTGSLENIYINAQMQMLLLYSMDCMVGEKEVEAFSCKFLANESDREKIMKAREVLLENIGEPMTIKELSRKVAINECYLKKGFKEMFGTTIFDFYQSQRMEHARYLLYEKGLSVTDVSMMLGYSSISHFSTAFKKHTGLKPCELLLR